MVCAEISRHQAASMVKILYVVVVCVLAGASGGGVYGEGSRDAKDGVRDPYLEVSASKIEASVREPIEVTVTLHNPSSKTLSYVRLKGGLGLSIDVRAQDGKRVPKTRYGRRFAGLASRGIGSAVVTQLDPGESREVTFDLDRINDLTIAGTYSVDISVSMASIGSEPLEVKADPVRVIVRDDDRDVAPVVVVDSNDERDKKNLDSNPKGEK